MFEYHHNTLGVYASLLYDDMKVMSYSNYKQKCKRRILRSLRRASRNNKALVEFRSLPEDLKTKVVKWLYENYPTIDLALNNCNSSYLKALFIRDFIKVD